MKANKKIAMTVAVLVLMVMCCGAVLATAAWYSKATKEGQTVTTGSPVTLTLSDGTGTDDTDGIMPGENAVFNVGIVVENALEGQFFDLKLVNLQYEEDALRPLTDWTVTVGSSSAGTLAEGMTLVSDAETTDNLIISLTLSETAGIGWANQTLTFDLELDLRTA